MNTFLIALLAAALFGVSTPISKLLLSQLTLPQLAGLLYLGAALGTGVVLLFNKSGIRIPHLDRDNRLRLGGAIIFGGILGPLLLLWGLNLATSASVSLWLNLELVATVLLGTFFFRDHLGRWGWLGAGLIGVAAIGLSGSQGNTGILAGTLLAAACLCWGLDNHWTALIDGLTPTQSVFWKGLVAGSTNLTLGLFLGDYTASAGVTGTALATGALSYGASIVLYVTAAQSLGATRSQMIFTSAPFFGLFFSWLLLREPLGLSHALSSGLLIVGIACLFRDKHNHAHAHEALHHTHAHSHDDGHHDHSHAADESENLHHTHPHLHEPLRHAHPHWPDLQHRHSHKTGN